jgi:L-histidine N-alpha-methyltransferase
MDRHLELAFEVRRGLTRLPRELPSRYFYDARGSELFEEITRLPEYYPTRAEAAILERSAHEIVLLTRPDVMVELGAGSCAKTRLLIDEAQRRGLRQFVPLDISTAAVEDAVQELAETFPALPVHGLVGDFRDQLGSIPRIGSQLVLFLGSTIGNFEESERLAFLRTVRSLMRRGDHFLLGVDLVKDERTLHAAYNDSRGVTAAFNLNLLAVLNRELGADFDTREFEHVAFYSAQRQRIEMHLRSRLAQTVRVPGAGLTISLAEGEQIRTEISAKFTRESAAAALEAAGLCLLRWFTDPGRRFGLALAQPAWPEPG